MTELTFVPAKLKDPPYFDGTELFNSIRRAGFNLRKEKLRTQGSGYNKAFGKRKNDP